MEQLLGKDSQLVKHALWVLVVGTLIGYCTIFFAGASAGLYDPAAIDTGDTAWMLAAAALVMIMTPAVGFFYGGMVSSKNVVSVIKQSVIVLALISVQWVVIGYSLAFGPDTGQGLIGNLAYFGLQGVGYAPNADYVATIPHLVFMIYQAMFAIITPALIIGAFVERIKFKTFVAFTLLWATLVYDPIAHWVWSPQGWLHLLGAMDFAGGTVVHMSSGFAALAAALVVGKRLKRTPVGSSANNIPFVILGAVLLWFGWFGFNAGSALASGALAASAFRMVADIVSKIPGVGDTLGAGMRAAAGAAESFGGFMSDPFGDDEAVPGAGATKRGLNGIPDHLKRKVEVTVDQKAPTVVVKPPDLQMDGRKVSKGLGLNLDEDNARGKHGGKIYSPAERNRIIRSGIEVIPAGG